MYKIFLQWLRKGERDSSYLKIRNQNEEVTIRYKEIKIMLIEYNGKYTLVS